MLYDCLYDFATVANAASDAVLMLFAQQDERRVQLRAMLDSSDAESERMAATFDELRASLEKHRLNIPSRPILRRRRLSRMFPFRRKGANNGRSFAYALVVLLALLSVFFLAAFTQAVHALFMLRGVKCRLPG